MGADGLMIGDWVFCTYKQKNYKVAEIKTVAGGDLKVVVYDDNIPLVFQMKYFEPIQLTKEILKKNGFEDIGDDTWQLTERPCWFWVDFLNRCYGCDFDTSTYEYEDIERRLHLRGVPSVHELQHSLKLCGIEKEIKLED